MTMRKILLILLLLQATLAKKKNKPVINDKISETVGDSGDWFSELLYKMSVMIGLEKQDPSPSTTTSATSIWSLNSIINYAYKTFNKGYKIIKKTIPMLDLGRKNSDIGATTVNFEALIAEILLNLPPDILGSDDTAS